MVTTRDISSSSYFSEVTVSVKIIPDDFPQQFYLFWVNTLTNKSILIIVAFL